MTQPSIRRIHGFVLTTSIAAAVCLAGTSAAGPISLAAGDYFQDFDTLTTDTAVGTWVDDDETAAAEGYSLVGWHHAASNAEPPYSFRASNGGTNTSRLYSHGSSDDPDRALGSVNNISAVGVIWHGARFVNDTGQTIQQFTVTYDGEQWRDNGSNSPDDLLLQYQIFDAGTGSISADGYLTLEEATFVSLSNNANPGGIDGNDPAHRTAGLTATRDIELLPGQELWVRFEDNLHVGDDHGLAVDNFRLSTVIPEPTVAASMTLLGGLLVRRRR